MSTFEAICLDTVSKRARYTVRQVLKEAFTDKDSDYGQKLQALMGEISSGGNEYLQKSVKIPVKKYPALSGTHFRDFEPNNNKVVILIRLEIYCL